MTAETSQFHNITAADLADMHGRLGAEIAELEARRKAIADELIARGIQQAEGDLFEFDDRRRDDGRQTRPQGDRARHGRVVDRQVPEMVEALRLGAHGAARNGPGRVIGNAIAEAQPTWSRIFTATDVCL